MADLAVYSAMVVLPVVAGGCLRNLARRSRWRGRGEWIRVALGNGLLLLLLVSTGLLSLETYYRFFCDRSDAFGLTRVSKRWFKRHYRLNNMGFRDEMEYALRQLEGRRRLTFIGDSFTAGHGVPVEARFAQHVRRSRPGWEVHVLARNGADTGDELALVRRLTAEGYGWDEVVLVYCLNDISDLVPAWQSRVKQLYHEERAFLVRHSFAVNEIYWRWRVRSDAALAGYFGTLQEAYSGSTWAQQQSRLRALRREVEGAGGELKVVTFPFLHDMGPSYPYDEAHGRLEEFWREEGMQQLDMLPVFGRQAARELVISERDPHPSVHAHLLAGAAIEAFVGGLADLVRPVEGPSK